jgi:mRNA-degrading endonuclease RelE of RelBE toxin-antitoxin system
MIKLEKFLSKLVPKERVVVQNLAERIIKLDLAGLDVKKLTDSDGIYRVRKGDIRIKFIIVGKSANILEIGRRNDTTYN